MSEKMATVLWDHVQNRDLCPGTETLDAWLDNRWIRTRIRGRVIPILPVIGYRNSLVLHDVHHVLTGYDTRLSGEIELAAWELASGGCGLSLFFWVDRMFAVLFGVFIVPRRLVRAFRRGWRCRNLYGARGTDVLAMDYDDVVARVDRLTSPS